MRSALFSKRFRCCSGISNFVFPAVAEVVLARVSADAHSAETGELSLEAPQSRLSSTKSLIRPGQLTRVAATLAELKRTPRNDRS